MKQHFPYLFRETGLRFRLAVILAGFAVALALSNSDAGAQEKTAATPLSGPSGAEPGGQPYALEIADGLLKTRGTHPQVEATLANVVDALRELYPNANIAVAPEVAKLIIADLKLRSTRLEDALEALTVAGGNGFAWRKGGASNVDPSTGLPPGPTYHFKTGSQSLTSPKDETPLYFLYREPGAGPSMAGRAVEAFNVRGYLESLGKLDKKQLQESLDDLEQIVVETLSMLKQGTPGDQGRLEFRFHPGASLLVVVGPREGIEVARKVIMALPGQAGLRGAAEVMMPPPDMDQNYRRELQEIMKRRYGLRPGDSPMPGVPPGSPSLPR